MKTCKNYCDEYVKKQKSGEVKLKKNMREGLKKTRSKLKRASKKEKPALLGMIKMMKSMLNKTKDNDKMYTDICNKYFCNPECKGLLNPASSYKNTIMDSKNKKMREDGATSFCML